MTFILIRLGKINRLGKAFEKPVDLENIFP